MLKYGTLITLFLFFFDCACGQTPQPIFTTYTSADGLSLSNVNNVQADAHGFLWIATEYGLNKFDGTHFTRFYASNRKQVNGLTGNTIKQVLCDSVVTWMAIDNGGVNCYFNEIDYFTSYVHDPGNPASLVSNAVNCLLLSKDKKVYIGTDSGLSIFTRDVSSFKNIVEHPVLKRKLHVTSFTESGDGIIWIGTNQQGLLFYNSKTGIHTVPNFPSAIQSTIINDLMYDQEKHELWLATTNGLWSSKKNDNDQLYDWRHPFTALHLSSVECIKKNDKGHVWAGTSSNGIYWRDTKEVVYHFTANDIYPGTLVSNRINDIFCKADGTVWLSTTKGLQVYHYNLQRFPVFKTAIHYNHEIIPAAPSGLCLWNKYLVAATEKGVWMSDTNFLKSYSLVVLDSKKQPVRFTNVLIIDSAVFITGSNGIYQLAGKAENFRLTRPGLLKNFETYIRKPCNDFIKTNDSIFWIATGNKCIYIVNRKTGKADTLVPENTDHNALTIANTVTRLYKDRKGRVLVGTADGMGVYASNGLLLHPFRINSSGAGLKTNYVYDFYDDDRSIWVATYGKGLLRCDENLAVLNEYTTTDGLCDNTIYCIQPDEKGNLWLTTNRGLSVFDTTSKRFINYYRQHGLPSQEFNLFGKTSFQNRTLYFSSAEGIIRVRPFMHTNQSVAPLHTMITKMTIGNEITGGNELAVINERPAVTVDYGKNIALSFAVIDFLNTDDYTLQYKLREEDPWLDILSGTEIILGNLSPGSHKLYARGIIKAENRAGEPLILILSVKPAYYQQWWFIASVFVISVLIIYGIYKYRISQIRKVITLRTRISQDLHDNVGAALSSISIFSQAAIQKSESGNLADSKNILERIGETSREVMGELNDAVWLINPRNDNLQKIIQRISNYALPLCRTNDIHFEIKAAVSVENLDLNVDKRKAVYLIIKEAVNNSLKYASPKNLVIQFDKNRKGLHVSIKDDGRGFAEDTSTPGNGLTNMKQRTKNVNGKITFVSEPQKGTEIILQVPLTNIGD